MAMLGNKTSLTESKLVKVFTGTFSNLLGLYNMLGHVLYKSKNIQIK